MKNLIVTALSLLTVFAASQASAQGSPDTDPTQVPSYYSAVYAPPGFDSNDHVQIVGEGAFRNSCYRPAPPTVRIAYTARRIFLGPAAYEYEGICLQVILPFDRVIDVGILPPGIWSVYQANGNGKLGEINIRAAISKSADDFLYAPISQAYFHQSGSIGEIILNGDFSNSCMAMESIKVTVENNVISVQPIAKMVRVSGCINGHFPFTKRAVVNSLQRGRFLLHVRSMNGNAVNSLVNVY